MQNIHNVWYVISQHLVPLSDGEVKTAAHFHFCSSCLHTIMLVLIYQSKQLLRPTFKSNFHFLCFI